MSNKKLNSLNTLDRELSSRVNHPDINLRTTSSQSDVQSSESLSSRQNFGKSISLKKSPVPSVHCSRNQSSAVHETRS